MCSASTAARSLLTWASGSVRRVSPQAEARPMRATAEATRGLPTQTDELGPLAARRGSGDPVLVSREAVAQVRDHGRLLSDSPTACRAERVADIDSALSRGGRRHVRELVGNFSNALDICDRLTRKLQRAGGTSPHTLHAQRHIRSNFQPRIDQGRGASLTGDVENRASSFARPQCGGPWHARASPPCRHCSREHGELRPQPSIHRDPCSPRASRPSPGTPRPIASGVPAPQSQCSVLGE